MDMTRDTTQSAQDLAASANSQLKAAGIDTEKMVSRAGDLSQMIKDEIAARPFQALAAAAFVGFMCGLRR